MIKAGILEIADIFVINKADLPGAKALHAFLNKIVEQSHEIHKPQIISTIATQQNGIQPLISAIENRFEHSSQHAKKRAALITLKALKLIERRISKTIQEDKLQQYILQELKKGSFNLYHFLKNFY